MKGLTKLLVILLLFICSGIYAGISIVSVNERHISRERLKQYSADKELNYDRDYTANLSWWDRFKEWLAEKMMMRASRVHTSASLLDFIFILLIAGAIVVLVYFLTKVERGGLFTGSGDKDKIGYGETHEDIHTINFDTLINDAIAKTQYRTAVQYLYLKTLKALSDKNLVKWKPDKTNRDYTIELRSSPYGLLFSEITLLFDYSWYGNASLNEGSFHVIKNSFEQFNLKLMQGE